MAKLEGQALVILGAPRSGTSVTVNAFRLLGFFLGDEGDFPEPKEGNPAGIYERSDFLRLSEICLDTLYIGHERPRIKSISDHPTFSTLVAEAGRTMEGVFAGHDLWGWKDPKATFVVPVLQSAFEQAGVAPSYLLCVRSPAEVIASQEKIYQGAETKLEAPIGNRAYRRWMEYALNALRFTVGRRRAMIVYHQLLENPAGVLQTAYRSILGVDPAQELLAAAAGSVRQDLHRNRSMNDVPPDAPPMMGRLWELCLRIGQDPEGLNGGVYDAEVDAIDAEYASLEAMFSEPEPPLAHVQFDSSGGKTYTAPPVSAQTWTTLTFDIAGEPGPLLGRLYAMPANVFVKNARWEGGPAILKGVNDTAEGRDGDLIKFSVGFSTPQVLLQSPPNPGIHRLSLDLYFESNVFVVMECLHRQTQKSLNLELQLKQARTQPNAYGFVKAPGRPR